jgi:hypothetical protein
VINNILQQPQCNNANKKDVGSMALVDISPKDVD